MHPAAFQYIRPTFRYAVIGATTNTEKYGYRVLHDLSGAGFSVVGVNPHYTDIEGTPIYPNVAAVPDCPDVAVVVIPPKNGLAVLDEIKKAGIEKVWFQPGAESDAIRERVAELGLTAMCDGSCIMALRKRLGAKGAATK